MMKLKLVLVIVFAALLKVSQCSHNVGVCYRGATRYRTAYRAVVSHYSTYSCGFWGWGRCIRTHYARESYSSSYTENIFGCCNGYSLCGPNQCCSASSNYAQEFYIGFMQGVAGNLSSLNLIVGTSATSASFTIEASTGLLHQGSVTRNLLTVVSIPAEFQVIDNGFSNREKGIHIYSNNTEPLFVLAEIRVNNVSYPFQCQKLEELLSYEYLIASHVGDNNNLLSSFLLVGSQDNTSITIIPTHRIIIPEDPQTPESVNISIDPDVRSHLLILHKMQTLLVISTNDLTGTKILSDKPLTIISGQGCASKHNCEPVAVQMPPIATWGTKFLLTPFAGTNQTNPQVFKAVANGNSTSIFYTCEDITLLAFDVRRSFQFSTDKCCYLESTRPILLIQLSSLNNSAFSVVSPIDQFIHEIDFISLPTVDYPSSYINIMVPTDHSQRNNILLDGSPINCQWKAIYNRTRTIAGYGCNVTISSSENVPTHHKISQTYSDGRLSVLVYGFGSLTGHNYAYLTGQFFDFTALEIRSVPFVDVRSFSNYKELDKTQVDSVSDPIYIPSGLFFGNEFLTVLYVNENGVISFGEPWKYSYPDRFPTNYFYTRRSIAVAPFWSDNDIRLTGAVRYATVSSNDGSSNEAGQMLLSNVNGYIRTQPGYETFTGNWLLIAHWDNVHPSPHGDGNHRGISEDDLQKMNNYQAIIVTDGVSAYAVFNYICGGLQWSSIGSSRAKAVVGFNADGIFYSNHPLSGYSSVGEHISCPTSTARRQKRQQEEETNMFVALTANGNPNIMGCRSLSMMDESSFISLNDTLSAAAMLDPCPCTRKQARRDNNFVVFPDEPECYISVGFESFPSITGFPLELTQQCCYDASGAIRTSIQDGMVGTLLLYHPLVSPVRYNTTDRNFRQVCCGISKGLCDEYIQRRPINNCSGYEPPAICTGSGDPHYTTFDGRYYTFNGFGEYVLLEALSEDSETPKFTLQGRLAPIRQWRVSTQQALAFGDSSTAFHFGLTPGFRIFQTRQSGFQPEQVEITNQLQNGQTWIDPTRGAVLVRNNNKLTAVFIRSRIALTARVNMIRNEYYINFQIQVPKSFSERTQGFLGNLDGNPTNDFVRRGESIPLSNNIRERVLLREFETWRTQPDESLFYNGHRRKRQADETFGNSSFVPIFSDELNFTEMQRLICQDNMQCLFDFAVTGERDIALETLQHEQEANATHEELNNFPPVIRANPLLTININIEANYTLLVEDSMDNFTLNVRGGLPENSVLEKREGGMYIFHWNLQQPTTAPLVFIANDSRGAASSFVPRIEICACVNGGVCILDGLHSINSTILLNCQCNEAFSGQFCEDDRNGCSEIQCFEGVECMDVPAPGVGAVCGSCPQGFTGDTSKCYDIDECADNVTLCGQICTNTDGSYFCSCMDGFELIEGSNQCRDIDECNEPNECQQVCMNTEGSYTCHCNEGFSLAPDSRNCTSLQACTTNNTCSHICAVVNGVEECHCLIGFELSIPGGTQCIDQDECQNMNGLCEQICFNTSGSYECRCKNGFELQSDGHSCEDIDECLEAALVGNNLCETDKNTWCVNSEGSYTCKCVSGYTRENGTCQRIENEIPPPPPQALIPNAGIENSVNYTAPTLTFEEFIPRKKQLFRKVTAAAVNMLCFRTLCKLIPANPNDQNKEENNLMIDPLNVAILNSLISANEAGHLQLTFYVQLQNGFFLSRDQLEIAVEEGNEQYIAAGFQPGVNLTLPESIFLTENETKEICVMVEKNKRNISLSFIVEPKSATSANNDFIVVSEETVISAGVLQACIQLLAVDDNIVEGYEVFAVIVEPSNPSDTVNGSSTVIISDNDGINLELNGTVFVTEGNLQDVCMTVSNHEIAHERNIPISITILSTESDTFSTAEDLSVFKQTTSIPIGKLEACFQILATDDNIAESNEVFTIKFKATNPKDMVTGTASVTISDNDGVSISVGSSPVFLTEGEMKKVCVMVSANQQQHERDIPLLLSAGTSGDANVEDALTIIKGRTFIPIGEMEACFTISAKDRNDLTVKSDLYFTMKVGTVNQYDTVVGNGTVAVIITDNNGLPPEVEVNAISVTLTDHTATTFDSEQQQQFREVTAKAINEYCLMDNSMKCEFFESSQRLQEPVSAEDIILRDISSNDQSQVVFLMLIQISIHNESEILRGSALLDAIKAHPDIYEESGYLAPIISAVSPPASTHKPSRLSDGATAAVIFTVLLVVAVIAIAVGTILTLLKQHGYLKMSSMFGKHMDPNRPIGLNNYIATNINALEKSEDDPVDEKKEHEKESNIDQ